MRDPGRRAEGRLLRPYSTEAAAQADRTFSALTLGVLLVDLTFGGATHGDALSSAVVRLASLALLVAAIWRLAGARLPFTAHVAIGLLVATAAVPMLQLIPLPPDVWARLPGHAFLTGDYRAAGLALPWRPLSLSPFATLDALLSLVPPAAMFLATLTLHPLDRRRMVLAIPLIAVAAVALGMLQVAGGPDSPLRFYAETNRESAVGFFANRNHHAALLVAGAALAPFWITAFRHPDRGLGPLGPVMALAIEIALVVGLGVTRSRAGVLLAGPAVVAGVLAVLGRGDGKTFRRSALALLGAGLVGAGLVALFASSAVMDRFKPPLSAEVRVQALPAIERAAQSFMPAGSGLGTFEGVYQTVEPLHAVTIFTLNHAHNDFVELWLETGALGLVLGGIFLLWWAWATSRLWRPRNRTFGDGLQAAGSVMIALLLAHSFVDYPLRTAALASLFAFACGLLAAPGDPEQWLTRRMILDGR